MVHFMKPAVRWRLSGETHYQYTEPTCYAGTSLNTTKFRFVSAILKLGRSYKCASDSLQKIRSTSGDTKIVCRLT